MVAGMGVSGGLGIQELAVAYIVYEEAKKEKTWSGDPNRLVPKTSPYVTYL